MEQVGRGEPAPSHRPGSENANRGRGHEKCLTFARKNVKIGEPNGIGGRIAPSAIAAFRSAPQDQEIPDRKFTFKDEHKSTSRLGPDRVEKKRR